MVPIATEIHIAVAEPIIENRPRWKCKMPFLGIISALCLGMLTFLMFVFWNQKPR
jgi:hypothetical protein